MAALMEVTQADRDAAADLNDLKAGYAVGGAIRRGDNDEGPSVQAFARHRLAHSEPRPVAGFTWPEPKLVPVKHGQQLNPDRIKAAFDLLNGEMVIGEQLQLIEMLLDGTDITLATGAAS